MCIRDRNVPNKVKGVAGKDGLKLVKTTMTEGGSPAVYLFDGSEGGYLLVAADDVAPALLGYGDDGSEIGLSAAGEGVALPPQMEWWLGEYAKEIASAQAAEDDGELTVSWPQKIQRPERGAIAPMVKTVWNQSAPFNDQCPLSGGQRTVTGCVATAVAQVMKYFNYPSSGSGTGTATVNGGSSQTMDLNVALEWGKMLDNYNGDYTTEEGEAVATLMKAVGFSVGMNYTTTGSGAQGTAVAPALINNFNYDGGARYYQRIYYGLSDWETMIYDNLEKVGPVYYDGSAPGGGHAFVCDGYSQDGYFHFNWGWGGSYNGYFLLTALNPEGQGIGGFSGGYNTGQGVVLGIRKPTGEPVATDTQLTFELYDTATLNASVSGYTFTMEVNGNYSGWFNLTGSAFTSDLGVAFENVSNPSDVKYMISYSNITLQPYSGFPSASVNIGGASLTQGATYRAYVVNRSNGGDWQRGLCPLGEVDYALVKRTGANSYTVSIPEAPMLTATDLSLDTPLYYGQPAKMTATIVNDGDEELLRSVTPVLFSISGGSASLAFAADPIVVDLEGGESVTRQIEFTFNRSSSAAELGKQYYLGLIDEDKMALIGYINRPYTFTTAPAAGTLSASQFALVGTSPVADASDVVFDATVRLSSGYLAAPVYVAVVETRQGGDVFALGTSETLYMDGGQSYTMQIHVDMSTGTPGKTYYAMLCSMGSNSLNLISNNVIPFKLDENSGVETVSAEVEADEAEAEYYTLQGVRVSYPEKGGVYIVKKGGEVFKMRY